MADKRRLLIVEDDLIMSVELSELLDEEYQVLSVVPTGTDAVEFTKSHNPEIVLMDIKLKGEIDGLEAARRIRGFSAIPIVFLTGYKNTSTVRQASEIPRSFFLTKPFDPSLLLQTLEKALEPGVP